MTYPSKCRRVVFSCPEGGNAVLEFPTPLTSDTLEMLSELTSLLFQGLKRDSDLNVLKKTGDMADVEYLSWFA